MAGKIKQALEKEVTCPLCLDLFKEPKRLPCDHVYCKDCLQGLSLRSLDRSISCPECCNVTDIPDNDVNNYSTAFRINRLVEVFNEAKDTTDNGTRSCRVHKDKPLTLYCEMMLCQVCVSLTKVHVDHKFDRIESYREKHENRLRMTKELLSQVDSQISEVEGRIRSEETANLEAIDCTFEDLHMALEENKQSMKQQLSQKYQSALNKLSKHKLETESIKALATHVNSLVQGAIKGQNEELFTYEKWIKKNVKKLKQEFGQFQLIVEEPHLPVSEVYEP